MNRILRRIAMTDFIEDATERIWRSGVLQDLSIEKLQEVAKAINYNEDVSEDYDPDEFIELLIQNSDNAYGIDSKLDKILKQIDDLNDDEYYDESGERREEQDFNEYWHL